MSEIDKSLPNVKQEIELPSEEEVVEASQAKYRRTSWTRRYSSNTRRRRWCNN